MILILAVLFAFAIAFFATQNTAGITLHLASYVFSGVPLYVVMLIALLVGLFIAWIVHMFDSLNSTFTIHGKDANLRKANDIILDLKKQVQNLQGENASLRTHERQTIPHETTEVVTEEKEVQRTHPLLENLRHTFS